MKRCFVTFGDANYRLQAKRLAQEASQTGEFDEIWVYDENFRFPNSVKREMTDTAKGCGYWLWKPVVIYDALGRLEKDDILVYADAGCTVSPHPDWKRYFRLSEGKEGLFFMLPSRLEKYCKQSVIKHYCYDGSPSWLRAHPVQAGFMVLRKCESNTIIRSWRDAAVKHPDLFKDCQEDEKSQQSRHFKMHRHDQAVLSAIIYSSANRRARLIPEEIEHRYAEGQPVLATRLDDSHRRNHIPPKAGIMRQAITWLRKKAGK